MQLHLRLGALIDEMLDGRILLEEAAAEFERLYIEKALRRNRQHLTNTAKALGIHRNTLSKRVATYEEQTRPAQPKTRRAAG